jgi:HEAT repeat protein/sugar phosphate isomerase/epimerase/type 1 glutamine amidotransferase
MARLMGFLALGLLVPRLAAAEPFPLNNYTRLGQRLTATMPWNGVWIVAPSWSDNEGGLTLTIWDSPARERKLAQQTFVDFADNARLEVWLPQIAPPGAFYWEIGDRTGQTRVGLYANPLDPPGEDCAYFDGVANPKLKFLSGPSLSPGRQFADVGEMIAVLKSDAAWDDKVAACRELTQAGDAAAIPVLAGLLGDEKLGHMARYALERMADPAAGQALRDALGKVQGALRVGVINSLGVRHDADAIPLLIPLLKAEDAAVASAAAVALGRIGTPATAAALTAALDGLPALPAIHEGCLNCADRLREQGQREAARALYDRLRGPGFPVPVREAALRGALTDDPALLVEQLRSPDPVAFRTALWVLPRELPGAETTRAAGETLAGLPPERQSLLVDALGGRGDAAALPTLVAALQSETKNLRLAAVRNLPRIGGEAAVAPLLEAATAADADVAKLARTSLANLPGPSVDQAVLALLASPEQARRAMALELVGRRRMQQALPAVAAAVRDADPVLRLAALEAAKVLAGVEQIPELVQALERAEAEAERKAAEGALVAVCGRCGLAAVEPLKAALATASERVEGALLRALAQVGGEQALAVLVERLADQREPIRQEALRLLTGWRTREAVPHLLALARQEGEMRERVLALRALVRLASPRKDEWGADEAVLAEVMGLSQRAEEKRLVLGVLGEVGTSRALTLAARALADPELATEAGTAAVTVAEKLPRPGDSDIGKAMETVLERTPDAAIRQRAEQVLAKHRAAVAAVEKSLAGKLPEKAPAVPRKPRRLLLFDVNVTYGGHPARFAANDAFTLMGRTTGAFEAVVSRDPEVFRPENLKQFDAVCFNSTVGLLFDDPVLQQSLADFVYGGGGLLGVHASTFAFIDWGGKRGDTWPEFGVMLGARGGAHGAGDELVTVKLDDPIHPLNTAFGGRGFDYRDEFFRVQEPYSRDRVRVLFSIDGAKTDLAAQKLPDHLKQADGDYALAWVRNYGRGRVCYCTIGHNPQVFADPIMLSFYLGAIQFVLGDLPAPTLPSNRLTPAVRAQEALGWRFGMTAYSLHKYTFFETVDKTAELGLSYINSLSFQKVSEEIPKMFGPELADEEIRHIRRKLDAGHVRLVTHFIGRIPSDEAGCRRVFEFARKLGIETLISEPPLADLDQIERFCDEYDVQLAIHNHGEKESPNYWHPEKVMAVCQGRSPRIGVCADIGYWLRSGVDPIQGIRTIGDRLQVVQMHDLDVVGPQGQDVPWGTGAGRARELIGTIHELGLKPTLIELEYSRDWFESMPKMAQCAAFFDQVVLELTK